MCYMYIGSRVVVLELHFVVVHVRAQRARPSAVHIYMDAVDLLVPLALVASITDIRV